MRTAQLNTVLAGLDADQRNVVSWSPADGHLRVLAAAGSGKTHSLTALISRLIADDIAHPTDIIGLTFGNKAAKELNHRLTLTLTPSQREGLRVSTYHSLARRALARTTPDAQRGGWEMPRCIDAAGKTRAAGVPPAWVLWQSAVEYGRMPGTGEPSLSIKAADPREYALAADILRSRGVESPAQIVRDEDDPRLADFDEAWKLVISAKNALNVWDFADTLAYYHRGLTEGTIGDPARIVIVDEAQDNSWIQLEIARALARDGRLVLTGDVRQAIHVWRGAHPELLADADTTIGAETREIRNNYRSGRAIVDLGNRIAEGRPWAKGSPAAPTRDTEGRIEVVTAPAVTALVAERIADEIAAGASAGDYAILCRTNAALGEYQAALTEARIPCAIVGGTSIFDHREVETVLCYSILSQHDAYNSVDRVLNYPKRYLGRAFRDALAQQKAAGRPLLAAIRAVAPSLPPAQRRGALALADDLARLRALPWASVPDAILTLLQPTNATVKKARPDATPDEDRPGLYAAAAGIARRFADPVALYAFAERCRANAVVINEGDDVPAGRVTLSTAHRAKGLEWPHVYVDATMGSFPYRRKVRGSYAPAQNIEDECRLFYVACTRARDALTLAYDGTIGPCDFADEFLPAQVDLAERTRAR
jgi:DNA helicase-2/ATP-dependent DNA helicase PcrA